ncbi:MAG: VgrG-related protein, partial [Acidimicrobiales bacterium]
PHTLVTQANQTDWEFLKSRASEIGYEVVVVDGKFNFRKPPEARGGGLSLTGGPVELGYRHNLVEFRPRLNSSDQVGSVEVRSWDPARKAVVTATGRVEAKHASVEATPAGVSRTFGGSSSTHIVVDRPLATSAQARTMAEAMAACISSAFFEAEGLAFGDPKIQAGAKVEIAEVTDDFAGTYVVTNARHMFPSDEPYQTEFVVSGRLDRSTFGLLSLGAAHGADPGAGPPIPGLVIGIVDDNNDPDNLGRVKLQFPWLNDDYVSDWARVVQLGAGPESGAAFIPEVRDEVLVGFQFGDLRCPFVVGQLYNGTDKPLLGQGLFDRGKVKRRGFISRTGHKLIFFDDQAKTGIALISADGKLRVSINQTNKEIKVIAADSGKVTVETAQGDVTVKCGANVTIEAKQGITIKATGDLKLQGANVSVEGQAQTTIKGGKIALN